MRSELLVGELATIIRRLEHRVTLNDGGVNGVLLQDNQRDSLQHTLDGIEQAILGLVMLHIQLRRDAK